MEHIKREIEKDKFYSYTCTEPLDMSQMLDYYRKFEETNIADRVEFSVRENVDYGETGLYQFRTVDEMLEKLDFYNNPSLTDYGMIFTFKHGDQKFYGSIKSSIGSNSFAVDCGMAPEVMEIIESCLTRQKVR